MNNLDVLIEKQKTALIDRLIAEGLDGDSFRVELSRQKPCREAYSSDLGIERVWRLVPKGQNLNLTEGEALDTDRSTEEMAAIRCSVLKGHTFWVIPTDPQSEIEHPTKAVASYDNWTLYLLETEGQIVTEGRLLRHCVGNTSQPHKRSALAGETRLYSMRKEPTVPELTMEMRGGEILQIAGKCNRSPTEAERLAALQLQIALRV